MAFARPTLTELIDRVQNDLVTHLSLSGNALRRSVVYVFARAQAAAFHLLYGYQGVIANQLFPDTSEVEFLERQASLFGLTRLAATYATGSVQVSGTNGVTVPAGTLLQRADGVQHSAHSA